MFLLFMALFIKFLIDNLILDLRCIDFDFGVLIFKVIFSLIFFVETELNRPNKMGRSQVGI